MITLENVSFSRNNTPILNNIYLEIPTGSIISILGKSGIGKTTLLRCIAQLEQNYTGLIKINKKDIKSLNSASRAQLLGFVFQQYSLFSHLSILENCVQPLQVVKKWTVEKAQQHAYYFLQQLGVDFLADKYPSQLSGGQQQRVALARALCLHPKVLLLDEPTAALDTENIKNLQLILKKISQQGITIILATHNLDFAKSISDTVYTLQDNTLRVS